MRATNYRRRDEEDSAVGAITPEEQEIHSWRNRFCQPSHGAGDFVRKGRRSEYLGSGWQSLSRLPRRVRATLSWTQRCACDKSGNWGLGARGQSIWGWHDKL